MNNIDSNKKDRARRIGKQIATAYAEGMITERQAVGQLAKVALQYNRAEAMKALQSSDPKAWQMSCSLLSIAPTSRGSK